MRGLGALGLLLPPVLFAIPESMAAAVGLLRLSKLLYPWAPIGIFLGLFLLATWMQGVVTYAAMAEGEVDWRRSLKSGLRLWPLHLVLGIIAVGVLSVFMFVTAVIGTVAQGGRNGPGLWIGFALGALPAMLVLTRWAIAGAAAAPADQRGIGVAMRRSAVMSAGQKPHLLVLQAIYMGGIAILLGGVIVVTKSHVPPLVKLSAILGLLPALGWPTAFDAVLKVQAYRTLGATDDISGVLGVAAVFD